MAETAPPERVYPSPPEPNRTSANAAPVATTAAVAGVPRAAWLVRYRSPDTPASWAIAVVTVLTTFTVLNFTVALALVGAGVQWNVGEPPDVPGYVQTLLLPIAVMGTATYVLLLLVAPVALAAWASRCSANVTTMSTAPRRWSPGWAACGWFVPLANLVIPYLVIRELWAASRPASDPPRLIAAWWAAWVAQLGLFAVSSSPLAGLAALDSRLVIGTWNVIGIGVALGAGILAIVLVHRLTGLQDARHRELVQSGVPEAAPVERLPAWADKYASIMPSSSLAVASVVLAASASLAMFLVGAAALLILATPLADVDWSVFVVWGVALLAYVFTGLVVAPVATAIWMYRAYRNLPALGIGGLTWSPGWAAGAWFVPGANLFVPYLVAREIWRGSGGSGGSLLALWWAAWLTAGILLLLSQALYVGNPIGGDLVLMLTELALAVAAVLFIRFVRSVTRHQTERHLADGGFEPRSA